MMNKKGHAKSTGEEASATIPQEEDMEDGPMYSGKWTFEEEQFAEFLMHEFRNGNLPIADGTSLRGFLAKELHCGPKR